MASLALDLQYLTLQTKLKFDYMHMQNFIKRTTKKVRKEQKNKLDEIWDNHKELRFEIESDLVKAVERYSTNGSPISFEGIKRIRRSNKLVTFVLWYTTTKNPQKLEGTTQAEREFINAVAFELNQPKIYSDDGIADLKFYDVDSTSFSEDPAFITSAKEIKERGTSNFVEKVEMAKKDDEVKNDEENKPVELIVPFTFRASPRNTFVPGHENESVTVENTISGNEKQRNVPYEIFSYLEKYIAPIFNDTVFKYYYEYTKDYEHDKNFVLRIYVTGPTGDIRSYTIDQGTIYGSSNYAIIYQTNGYYNGKLEYLPISIKDKATVRRILTDRVTDITREELMKSVDAFSFKDKRVHQMFDLSGFDFDRLTKAEKEQLGDKLSKMHDVLMDFGMRNYIVVKDDKSLNLGSKEEKRYPIPRFRISSFKNVDDFSISSDTQVNSSLIHFGLHYENTLDRLTGTVKKDILTLNGPFIGNRAVYNLNSATWES